MRTIIALAFATSLIGCGTDAAPSCRVGADCASGICSASGQCKPPDDVGQGDVSQSDAAPVESDTSGEDSASMPDTGPIDQDVPFAGEDVITVPDVVLDPDAVTTVCTPNHDFVITRAEAPFPLGVTVHYLSATAKAAGAPLPVDLVGKVDADGLRHWKLDGALTSDVDLPVTTDPITSDKWFAEIFEDASYSVRLTTDAALLGVFETTPTALLLRGVVSPEGGTFRTELTYDTPIVVLPFPIAEGDTWTTDSTISGSSEGVLCSSLGGCKESYRSKVDAHGVLDTPFGSFRVLRVRVELDRTIGFSTTTTRTFLFVAECFATVGTVVSESGEIALEFTKAAEVRRIAPAP